MAIRESEILDKVGKYNLTTLDIISYQQQKDESAPKVIDIKGIADVINIHEDIFRHTIYGSVVVYDQQDIRSILPLTGLERLALKLNTPGLPGYDFTDEKNTWTEGHLAVQQHDPGSVVHYRKIEVRPLPDDAAVAKAIAVEDTPSLK